MWGQTAPGPSSDREVQYSPDGYPIGRETMTYPRRVEPATREAVDAVREHLDDSIKLLKAELGGQIDILRRDITELQGKREQHQQRGWDVRKIVLEALGYIAASGIGALIMWLLTHRGT
jgi:hypothetical protein